ncbi:hypothetical protein V6N13_104602 [Hibiscus sabdariffa]
MEELGGKLGFQKGEIEDRIETIGISGEALIKQDEGNDVVPVNGVNGRQLSWLKILDCAGKPISEEELAKQEESAIRLEEKELLSQIIEDGDKYKIFVANHEKFHAEADKHYWKAIAELIPNEMPTTEKRGKKDKEKEKKPSTVVVQGPKLGKPTDLSRMRQILLELKHETPLHLKHSPPAPEQVQDAKSGNSSVPPAAPVTSNRICRNCCLNSFLSTFISYKDKEKKPSIVVAQGPKSGKPTDLSTIRQILLELKHETPLHQNHSPPAPEQAQDAKSGNSSVPAAAPVTSNRRGRNCYLNSFVSTFINYKDKEKKPSTVVVQGPKQGNQLTFQG